MRQRLLLFALLLLLALGTGVPTALSHGIGKPQAINVENGPYLLSVWTDPDPLRVDQTHIVVAVMDPDTRAPLIGNVEVSVRLELPGDPDSALVETAESDNTVNQLLYVVQFNDVPTTGLWQATIIIDGERGLADELTIPLEITPPLPYNWMQIGIGSLVAVTVGWLVLAMLQSSAHTLSGSAAARRRVMSNR